MVGAIDRPGEDEDQADGGQDHAHDQNHLDHQGSSRTKKNNGAVKRLKGVRADKTCGFTISSPKMKAHEELAKYGQHASKC